MKAKKSPLEEVIMMRHIHGGGRVNFRTRCGWSLHLMKLSKKDPCGAPGCKGSHGAWGLDFEYGSAQIPIAAATLDGLTRIARDCGRGPDSHPAWFKDITEIVHDCAKLLGITVPGTYEPEKDKA